jgi:purine-binding chemotaxis protein CheW
MHDESKEDKFIVFKIADYLLGLPISDVLKVVNYSPTENGKLRTMGVVQIGRHMVKVLDFHQELSSGGLAQLPGEQPFLLITRDREGELCGILVDEPPNLVELPLEMIQSLPKSDHQSSIFQMVSHAAVISQQEITTTIFLLDMKRTLSTAIHNSHPLSLRSS